MSLPRCSFGSVFPCGPCAKCRSKADRLEREFWRDVFFGVFDADGYTKSERQFQKAKSAA